MPIQFEREYTSLCMFTLHSSVIDFKFYIPSSQTSNSNKKTLHMASDDEEDEATTFMENGILVERKIKEKDESELNSSTASSKVLKKNKHKAKPW